MGFESIIEKIKSLPPLPESVRKIQILFAQPDPDVKELIAIIERDPLLTTDILAKVNAPFYSLPNNIVSVSQAITLFGMMTIRGFAMHSTINRSFDIDMSPFNITNIQYNDICQMQSALMFQWYMGGGNVEQAKKLIPIAFVMEIGRVVIAQELLQSEYTNQFKTQMHECESVEELEKLYAGVTTAEVNSLLFEHWNFDELFIETMRYMDSDAETPHRYMEYVTALKVIRRCINVKEMISEQSIEAAKALVEDAGMDTERFEHAANRIRQRYEETVPFTE